MKIFLVFFVLALSLSSFAQEESVRLTESNWGSSATSRENKEFQLTAQVLGVGPNLVSSSGLQFGMFLDSNSFIFLEYTEGQANTLSCSRFHCEVDAKSFGLHYKKFASNSFYWRTGLDYRKTKVNSDSDLWSWLGNQTGYSFEGTSYALNFSIGNQWQWDTFTLGCDWVGYSLPIASSIDSESFVSTNPSYDRNSMKTDQDTFIKKGHINLLRFYLGWAF